MGTKAGAKKKVKKDIQTESSHLHEQTKKGVKKRKPIDEEKEIPKKKRKIIQDHEERKPVKKKPTKKASAQKIEKDEVKPQENDTTVPNEKVGRKFKTSCRPASLCKLVQKLNDMQKQDVVSIGFGGVLKFKSLGYMHWKLMIWFANHFNPSSRVLAVGGNNDFVVTAEDFRDLFLIPLNGRVVSKNDDESSATYLFDFKSRVSFDVCTTLEECKHKMLGLRDEGADFKRLFVLYAFSTFFTPSANRKIDFTVMKSLINVDEIANHDWCSYVLERLCRAVSSFRHEGIDSINGCIIALPLLYFHRCKWQGFPEPSSLPLIQHWTSTKIKERLIAEAAADHVGQGEWIDDVYPISSRIKTPQAPEAANVTKEHCVDGRCVILKIPSNEKTDIEITELAKDPMDEALLIFKRNFNIISSAYIQRMKELSINTNVQQEQSNPSTSIATAATTTAATATATATEEFDEDEGLFYSEEFCKLLDTMVLDFNLKRKMEKKSKKRFAEEDSIPKFNLLTPTPPSSDTTISLTPVGVATEDVVESYTLPPTPEDGENWPIDTSTLLSRFMKKYTQALSLLTQKEKNFVDYCFYNHRKIERENVFCHGGDFYVRVDSINSLDEDMVHSSVIDAWSLILSKNELDKAKPLVYWFHSHHSPFLERLFKAKEDDKLERATAVRGCWSYCLEKFRRYLPGSQQKLVHDFFSLEMIFFPICYEKHCVAAVIDFEKKKVFYLDNRKNGPIDSNDFFKMVSLLHQQFVIFLQDIKHPKADELNSYPLECPAFKWQNNNRNVDCGIFLMNHMQNFKGEDYNCVELERIPTRRILRAKYCAEIVLSPFNHLKKELEADVIAFYKRMTK